MYIYSSHIYTCIHICPHIDIHIYTYIESYTSNMSFVIEQSWSCPWRSHRTIAKASCRNTRSVTVCRSREALFAVTTWPATENKRSTGTLVAGMERCRRASLDKYCNNRARSFHHFHGLDSPLSNNPALYSFPHLTIQSTFLCKRRGGCR